MKIQEEAKKYAEKLIEKLTRYTPVEFEHEYAIEVSLIHVREILDPTNLRLDCEIEFYKLVEQELIKMK